MIRPIGGRGLELAAPLFVYSVVSDPARQRWPRRDHDLMLKVDPRFASAVVVYREQSIVDHRLEHAGEVGGIVADHTQLHTRLLAPRVGPPFAEANQPE